MEEQREKSIAKVSSIPSPIVLIDGVCLLCQGATKFIIQRDPAQKFHFASLQSDTGRMWLTKGGLSADAMNTIVLIENGNYYTKSTAALRISRHLKFPWSLLYVLIIVPKFIRDTVYQYIARHRYRWFGKSDQCMIPSPKDKERFLE